MKSHLNVGEVEHRLGCRLELQLSLSAVLYGCSKPQLREGRFAQALFK